MKKCKKCGKEFPATKEYFTVNKACKNGVEGTCLDCTKERHKQYYGANRERKAEHMKQYYGANKERLAEQYKQYRVTNSVKVAEYKRKWYEINSENHAKLMKKWHEVNKHTEKYKISNAIKSQRRRARKRELPATLTADQWENAKEYFDYKCAFCGEEAKVLTQEHFLAQSKNGGFTQDNILPACGSCNSSKFNHSFFEWYPKFKHYSKKREKKILDYLNYKNGVQQLSIL